MSPPWILMPVHNRRELTLAGLRHLAALGAIDRYRVLVIDDGSTDGTAEAIRREFPDVVVHPGDGRLWWTGAIRFGMIEADRAGAPAVLWLNDDCLPATGTIERLLEAVAGPSAAVAGASCVTEGGQPVTAAFIGRTPLGAPPAGAERAAVEGLSGFCVAVARRAWARIGFPDAGRFPHYYGDTDYTVRARRAGLPVVLLGPARATLVSYRGRPTTLAEHRARLRAAGQAADREALFRSPRSPFRAATQWHYLRLRYGPILGSLLASYRIAAWHLGYFLRR